MAQDLKLSTITIKRAYTDLEGDGYIVTRPGLGSFVAGIDRERLREEKVREVRGEIERIARAAAAHGIPLAEIESIVSELKTKNEGQR